MVSLDSTASIGFSKNLGIGFNIIDQLKSIDKLVEITHPVSPKFEAPRIAKEKGTPILFHDADGKQVVMNLPGSRDELVAMFGVQNNR